MKTLSLLALSLSTLKAVSAATACNNSPDLCDRSYSNVTHLGAHDSAFLSNSSNGFTDAGNQYFDSPTQLDAGVRLLSAQVHKKNNEWHLCHTNCDLLDAGKLSDWLASIKEWLDNNSHDVVTILLVNSGKAKASELKAEFDKSEIAKYAYTPTSTAAVPQSWPSLNDMISKNTRLVTFIASLDPATNTVAPYLLDEFTHIFENPYDVSDPSNFTCLPDRPTNLRGDVQTAISSGRLPFMNHFLYSKAGFVETPDKANITRTNGPSGKGIGNLGDAATNCTTIWGKAPTFILVDYFDQGPAIDTVDKLNKITPTGRKTPPAAQTTRASGGSNTFAGLLELASSAKSGKKPTLGNWVFVGGDWAKALGVLGGRKK
ncbi:MAG: hypothetical protein M1814_002484 [Vezdaea aestivalis]|nr:MAG: hypothetical protein M1814_002484 [Vezdaea aestivalis]